MKSFSPKQAGISPRWILSIPLTLFAVGVIAFLPFSTSVTAQEGSPGDAQQGKQIFERRCTGCHALDREKEGPRLGGVFGRKAGSVPSFTYSDAVKKADVVWNEESLNKWLTDPDKFIPDSDMDFHLAKSDERADVIAYLKQTSGK
jgi:cytochrome c